MVRMYIKAEYKTQQNRMIVINESGDHVFLIVGKWGRLGDKLSVYAMDGKRIVEARQVMLSVFPKFRLYQNGRKMGTIKKRASWRGAGQPFFTVTGLNWIISGDYDKQVFIARQFGKKILEIEKSMTFTGEFYTLTFQNERMAPVACLISQLLDHYDQNKMHAENPLKQQRYSLSFMYPIRVKIKKLLCSK
ncbi:hypothetical protein ADIAL_1104 [Alkalibacterium sp. AK22]|uniref:LURP-one-related/scramblase family protein n=1 Tax=Alkalibacterium sp. AK22 TaxID=1229520 RepID=UPI00044B8A3B|nr:hypothetical protein [Alkalibacterium sp. AK22]EXJ23492.1 hypothetical protein ADIAL_1104 [Alkalibacterium sp. AK22]